MTRTAIVGLGNSLMGDEGVGVAVVERLLGAEWLSGVTLIRGETSGLQLIPQLQSYDRIVFVDAAEFGAAPGEVRVFGGDELSLVRPPMATSHDVGLADLVGALMLLTGRRPTVWLVGIQVGSVALGLEVSEEVKRGMEPAVRQIRQLLEDAHALSGDDPGFDSTGGSPFETA